MKLSLRRHRSSRAALNRIVSLGVAVLAVASLAAPASADLSPRAKEILERYVQAMGGRALVESVTSSHQKATLTAFGFTGSVETWSQAPDRAANATKLGPFNLQGGFDGSIGWRTDPGGRLQMLDGKDYDRAKADAWFENDRYLAPDQGGGKVEFVGEFKDSTGSHADLEIAPPVGPSRRYAFDPVTWLPVRITGKNDQQTIVTTLSDYRVLEGRKIPFHTVTTIVGMPANTITVNVDSVWINPPIAASRFAAPHADAAPLIWLKHDGVARLPFAYRGRHVWLRASVNGGPSADFLYDTGASISVIDSAYAAQIGLKTEGSMQATGAGSAGNASFAHLQTLRVAGEDGDGVEVREHKVGVLSINPFLAPFFWRDCAGVLGYNFISQFVNEIDFDNDTLTLRDPRTFTYQGKGTQIPFTLAGTVPIVKMTLDGDIVGDYRLDVGSNSTIDIHGPFAKANDLDKRSGKSLEVQGGGFGGTFTSRLVRMKSLAIGPYSWLRPLVSLSQATTGALASEDYAGNAGNALLERFRVTFDYDHHALYLEPGKKYREPDSFSRAGVQFAKKDGNVIAMQVLEGSPAAKAGIEEGDVLVQLDGKAASEYDPDAISDLLEKGEVGRKVNVVMTHEGKEKKATVVLKELL